MQVTFFTRNFNKIVYFQGEVAFVCLGLFTEFFCVKVKHELQVVSCEFKSVSYEFKSASHGLNKQVTSSNPRVTSSNPREPWNQWRLK